MASKFLLLLLLACPLFGQAKRALIVDGVNNHDWEAGTKFLREVLERSGKFRVDVTTSPSRGATPGEWDRWRPQFEGYALVVQNFNGGHLENGLRWPAVVEAAFLRYLERGGGVLIFHAANNAFLGWKEYNEIVGLLWREPAFGPGLVVDVAKQVMIVAAGQGPRPGHGPRHDFRVDVLDRGHAITKGLGGSWIQKAEQLTHGQHGPAAAMKELKVLTYAWSRDSQRSEPMDWVRTWGKGRVYVTMLGHTWNGEDNPNLRVGEFREMLLRGAEWAARVR